jgi:ABC-type transport system involved in multi-copper enzyme maturation permease subunit
MSALVQSEVLKLATIRTLLWLGLANVALVLLTAVSFSASTAQLETAQDDRDAARIAATALIFALLSGIVVMAGEATHGTITQTLLVTPRRERVLAAKAVVAAVVGFALALVSELLVLAVLFPGSSLDVQNSRLVFLGVLLASALVAALGVGLGAIVHGQGAAIGISLVWLLLGENLVPIVSRAAEKYTPGRAFAALVSGEDAGDGLLSMAGGGVAAVIWTAVFLAAGLITLLGRDV